MSPPLPHRPQQHAVADVVARRRRGRADDAEERLALLRCVGRPNAPGPAPLRLRVLGARRARLERPGARRRDHPGNPRLVRRSPPQTAFPTPTPPQAMLRHFVHLCSLHVVLVRSQWYENASYLPSNVRVVWPKTGNLSYDARFLYMFDNVRVNDARGVSSSSVLKTMDDHGIAHGHRGIFHRADELSNVDVSFYSSFDVVWRNYWDARRVSADHVLWFPLPPALQDVRRPAIPSSKRPTWMFFSGGGPRYGPRGMRHGRHAMIEAEVKSHSERRRSACFLGRKSQMLWA